MTAKELLARHGLEGTYWGDKIIKAEKRGGFSQLTKRKASNWTTCACGKLDARIPRDSDGDPCDESLYKLGHRFYDFVQHDDGFLASETLIAIERRAGELLAGMEK